MYSPGVWGANVRTNSNPTSTRILTGACGFSVVEKSTRILRPFNSYKMNEVNQNFYGYERVIKLTRPFSS